MALLVELRTVVAVDCPLEGCTDKVLTVGHAVPAAEQPAAHLEVILDVTVDEEPIREHVWSHAGA